MSEEKYPPLVIQLINLAETNWILEGTEKSEKPKRMSWSSHYRILPTSKYREDLPEGGYKLIPIRFIMGCDYLDPHEQDKNKVVPNIEQDNIWISNGTLTVLREGSTLTMYDYLKLYEGNISNPKRPPEAENVFMEVVGVELAKAANVSFDKKLEAYRILGEIRSPGEDGTLRYDTEKLGIMSTLFNLNHLDNPDEKFRELFQIAEEKPGLIVDSIMNGKKKLFALIKKAEELSVLGLTDERAYFTSSNTVILAFKGKPAKNNQVNKLADYLLTEEGKTFLQQLSLSVETASQKSLERLKV